MSDSLAEHTSARAATVLRRSCGFSWSRLVPTALVALVVVYALIGQGQRGLWEPDEGRYASVALNMVESGDWLTPRLPADIPHYSKPPLSYWLMGAGIELFGRTELAVRLPGALAFVATTVLVAGIAHRLREARPALAAAIYATMLLPAVASNIVSTDSLLVLWETLAAYGFVASRAGEVPQRRRWLALMWFGFALAFATKGPPGLLPLPVFVLIVAAKDGWPAARRLVTWPGLALFAVFGLAWFVIVIARQPELLSYFLGYELLDRVFTSTHGRHGQWYGAAEVYIPTIILGTLPWWPLALPRWSTLTRSAAAAREHLRDRLTSARPLSPWPRPPSVRWVANRWRSFAASDPARALLVAWIVVPLLVFVVARSRMWLYPLPLCVPFAILVARRIQGRIPSRWQVALVTVTAVAIVGLRVGSNAASHEKDAGALATRIRSTVSGPIEDVLLVSTRNGFGLAFYLNAEVEHIAMDPGELHQHHYRVETLDEELAEHPDGRLVFIVHQNRTRDLEKRLERTERSIRRAGTWGRWDLLISDDPVRVSGIARSHRFNDGPDVCAVW